MTSIAAARLGPAEPRLIAPVRHTVLLVAIFVALALSGALFQRHAQVDSASLQQHSNMVPLYLSLIALEWGLFLYIRKGLGQTGFSLRELVGGRWTGVRAVIVDLSLAFALWGVWTVIFGI
jgi:hypothetical protein